MGRGDTAVPPPPKIHSPPSPYRDPRDDGRTALHQPVYLTYSFLCTLVLEALAGQLLKGLLELLKGDGPAAFAPAEKGHEGKQSNHAAWTHS